MIRVVIADDHDLIRKALRDLIDSEPGFEVVGEAADGLSVERLAHELTPDVILMDVRMPGMDGIEATRRLSATDSAARVIILTTFDLDEYAFGGLRAGASGFLLKDARPAELTAAIRAVAAGDAAVTGRVTRSMLELFADRLPASGPSATTTADPAAVLTPREREILLAMADGLTNGEIGAKFFLTESTVKTHVGRVLAKLQLRDRVHAVIFAYENGLVES